MAPSSAMWISTTDARCGTANRIVATLARRFRFVATQGHVVGEVRLVFVCWVGICRRFPLARR